MAKLGYSRGGGKGLSYSRLSTLHSCARKFEIENVVGYRPTEENMTFAYGHFVGAAIQEYIATEDLQKSFYAGLIEFDLDDPYAEGTYNEKKAKKSFFHAMDILEAFAAQWKRSPELRSQFKNLEIAKFSHNGVEIPALELTFEIIFEDGYTYEGHIDCVLYNKKTNEYIILELKTTGFTSVNEATYKNSAQALSYAIALDSIVKHKNANSSFSVLYLVCLSGKKEFLTFKFPKSVKKRAEWINNILVDISILDMYRTNSEQADLIYPQNGASCYAFFKPCAYFGSCDYSNARFAKFRDTDKSVSSFAEQEPPMFSFTIDEIIERQKELLKDKMPDAEIINDYGIQEIGDL